MPLSKDNVYKEVPTLNYAVQGVIVNRAQRINEDFQKKRPQSYPFKSVIFCNVGNPQCVGNDYLTFPRQVLSLLAEPKILKSPKLGLLFPPDVIARAKKLHDGTGHSGGYTPANGILAVRETIARFLERRDNEGAGRALKPADPAQIFMTNGASPAIMMTLRLLINGPKDGIMCPLPQYPLYPAAIQLYGGTVIPYYLDENNEWGIDMKHLEKMHKRAVAMGITPRALAVINPGNPTGSVLTTSNIDQIIVFCHQHGMVLLADEVYQENVYSKTKKFHSFRERVLCLGSPYEEEVQMMSFHSASKGLHGECGRRGGYLEMRNFPKDLFDSFLKLPALDMCANITGQWLMDLIAEPPQKGDASWEQYDREYRSSYTSYAYRAQLVVTKLNAIPGIKCLSVDGAFYAFAKLELPPLFVNECKVSGKETDFEWCFRLLEATGLATLPGSAFGQYPGTCHFRTTILPSEETMEDMVKRIEVFQNALFSKYADTSKAVGSKL